MIFRAFVPNFKDDAYRKLLLLGENKTEEQDSVTKGLIFLYNNVVSSVKTVDNQMMELATYNRKSYQKYPWYKDLILSLNRDEAIEFFLSNPEHIGRVTTYSDFAIRGHRILIELFDIIAVKCYRSICEYLDKKGLKNCSSSLINYNVNDYQEFVGVYKVKYYPRNTTTNWIPLL